MPFPMKSDPDLRLSNEPETPSRSELSVRSFLPFAAPGKSPSARARIVRSLRGGHFSWDRRASALVSTRPLEMAPSGAFALDDDRLAESEMELGAHVGGDGAGEGGWRAWPASEEAPSFSSRIAPVSGGASSVELVALVLVCTACVCMQAFTARRGATRHGATAAEHASFQRLRRRYNAVYVLGTFGDWIQGAYLYALYREHGFGMADIGYIFVLGYASSAFLGTYVASLGDAHGHRRFVVAYGVIYGAACFASRSSRLSTLLAARVASGVAYSLLFSSFESWAICEIDRLALDRRYLVPLFSTATFFNAVSAVAAGIAGNLAVDVEWGARMRDPPGKTRAAFVLPRGRLGDDEPSVASSGVFARDAVRTMKLKLERGASLGNKYSPAFDVGAVALLACAACARAWWADARASGAGTPGAAGDDDARGGGGGGGGVGDDRGGSSSARWVGVVARGERTRLARARRPEPATAREAREAGRVPAARSGCGARRSSRWRTPTS